MCMHVKRHDVPRKKGGEEVIDARRGPYGIRREAHTLRVNTPTKHASLLPETSIQGYTKQRASPLSTARSREHGGTMEEKPPRSCGRCPCPRQYASSCRRTPQRLFRRGSAALPREQGSSSGGGIFFTIGMPPSCRAAVILRPEGEADCFLLGRPT